MNKYLWVIFYSISVLTAMFFFGESILTAPFFLIPPMAISAVIVFVWWAVTSRKSKWKFYHWANKITGCMVVYSIFSIFITVYMSYVIPDKNNESFNKERNKPISITFSSGGFGPSSYEDCILENMKGVTDRYAAIEIKNACRKKFLKKQPRKASGDKIIGKIIKAYKTEYINGYGREMTDEEEKSIKNHFAKDVENLLEYNIIGHIDGFY